MNSIEQRSDWLLRVPFAHVLTGLILVFSLSPVPAVAAGSTGQIIGTVASSDTRNALQGATVSVVPHGTQVLTDNSGRFVIDGVAAGSVELLVSYAGFEDKQLPIAVSENATSRTTIVLERSSLIKLDAFTVSAEREGNALAVTEQRNAPNVKNVLAMDAYGSLPNLNAGELAVLLPGIAGVLDAESNITGISIRGMGADLSRLTVDGGPMATVPTAGTRDAAMHAFSGSLFEQIEVIKGQLPDRSADSIGGSVNLKTRSALSLTDRRRISYNISTRWVPSAFKRTPMRADHPIHPLVNFAYQQVFDVRGGSRNFGLTFNASYSENVNDRDYLQYDYRNTAIIPNAIFDFRSITGFNNRHVTSVNAKAEYRTSDATRYTLDVIYNQGHEPAIDQSTFRATANQNLATLDANGVPTGSGAILPNYTSTVTQIRGVSGSNVELNNFSLSYFSRNPTMTFRGEHKYGPWEIDYSARYSYTHFDSGSGKKGEGGQLVMRVPNVGWLVDTSNPLEPRFRQTEGADIYNLSSYTSGLQFSKRNLSVDSEITNIDTNFKYRFATRTPLFLKSGVTYRKQTRSTNDRIPEQWNRTAGAPPLPAIYMFETVADQILGRSLPAVDARAINGEVANPALWTADRYYTVSQNLIGKKLASEKITAAYVMAQGRAPGRLQRLSYVAGVRIEKTEVTGSGNVRGPLSTAAQIPDPVERAIHDYNNPVTNAGSYNNTFPSAHVTYNITKNLMGRASWSTSFGRPSFGVLVPTATVNDTAQTVVGANPGLRPQYSTNLDITMEYYFKPAGLISAGYFKKNIKDYIVSSKVGIVETGDDNGFAGNYAGYTLSTNINAGAADVEGYEFEYRQQFQKLPGLLKGLELSANYTILKAKGDFGSTTVRTDNEVAGFIPKTGHLNLGYNYKKLGLRAGWAYTGRYLSTYSASVTARFFREPLTTVNVGVTYRLTPKLSLDCNVTNITQQRVTFYRYVESQFNQARLMQSAVTLGLAGSY